MTISEYSITSPIRAMILKLRAAEGDIHNKDFTVTCEDFLAGEILHTHCNISKASKEFGYAPTTNLAEGVQRTWDWFQNREDG